MLCTIIFLSTSIYANDAESIKADNKKASDIYIILASVNDDIKNDTDVEADLLEIQEKNGITMKYLKEDF